MRCSMYHISRQSDSLFSLYGNFQKEEKEKKTEDTKPIFETSYLGNAWCDLIEIWNVGY